MQAKRDLGTFVSCKTHAATDVLMRNVLEVRRRLWELREADPAFVGRAAGGAVNGPVDSSRAGPLRIASTSANVMPTSIRSKFAQLIAVRGQSIHRASPSAPTDVSANTPNSHRLPVLIPLSEAMGSRRAREKKRQGDEEADSACRHWVGRL
jgi:hypothetical protein